MSLRNNLVLVFGVVFTLVGLLGFVQDPILNLFDVDLVHNLVHLVSGIAGLASFRSEIWSKLYSQILGAVYALVTVIGFVSPSDHVLGIIHINTADDYLHLVLAVALLAVGFGLDFVKSSRQAAA